MNFFEHQDQARRKSRRLVLLFILAVVTIVAAMTALVLIVFGEHEPGGVFLAANAGLIGATSVATLSTIGLSSLYRTKSLASGGGTVAGALGGVAVPPDTTDPLRRRLRNVVEEIAIASGMPVPQVFVLEQEAGINAFAAGYSPADAAVAVTRGALETLNRDELQGVIAHEFSHIANGDMRLNIRLIGLLFGILVLALVGRRVLVSLRHSRSRDAGAVVIIALAVTVLGYIGLFFGRAIRAAVSRQREYLADASAVQFTRNPQGVAGALKKIGALNAGSEMTTDTEEVGHMLFASGMVSQMFATHPPLVQRIRAIDPGFQPSEFKQIAESVQRHAQAAEAEREMREAGKPGPGGLTLDPGGLIEQIGQPGLGQILIAGALLAAIPESLERAAHSSEWACEVLYYLLLNEEAEVRAAQLAMIAETAGDAAAHQVRALAEACPRLADEQRLPLLELTFPGLRQRPRTELEQSLALIDRLIHADDRVTVFEYALGRLTALHIEDALNPPAARGHGSLKLSGRRIEYARDLIAIVARHGHGDAAAARAAASAALAELDQPAPESLPGLDGWPERLDQALHTLDQLKPAAKQRLIRALVTCVTHAGQVEVGEAELMRAICAWLHVPLPVFGHTGGTAPYTPNDYLPEMPGENSRPVSRS